LVVIANRPNGYDQALVDWLEPVLSTCASMIVADRNERLRKQVEQEIFHRNRELTVLNRVITASTTSSEPKEILGAACHELAQAFEVPRAVAFLLNEEKEGATVVAEYLAENQPVLAPLLPLVNETLLQPLLQHKMPLLIDETHDNPCLAPLLEIMGSSGLVWLLHLPLVVKDQLFGSLYLEASQSHDFSPDEINLARRVAEQVSGALARAQLMQARELLITIVGQAAESVVVTDPEGTIVYVNSAFERITGYSRTEAVGQTTFFLQSVQHSQPFEQELWSTIHSGQVWHGRLVNKKKDRTLFTEDATITPVRDARGNIVNFVSIRRDVTRELELEEQYRQAQKMEAVGLLAGGIAHDFNNMLTAINGYAGLLQLQLSEDRQAQEMIQTILRAGQRSADLVRQLLIFSRRQIVEPKILSLNTVVHDLEKMMSRIIGEHIDIKTNLVQDLWPIKADPTQIEQIILNLAVNAQDAMPEGGQLMIETANVILDENYVASHLAVRPGEYSALIVSDTGIGMSKAVQARIFEPFFTTKEMGRGTGLGLATVYGIVKQNGGSIWVYSEEGQGTTFKIYLPRILETIDFQNQSARTGELPQGTETILVVEDEPAVRELTEQVLNRQGYRVLTAARGPEALSLAQEYPQQIQLLLTDIVMPGMSGKALAEKLAQRHPGLKVIFMSGYSDSMIAKHGILEQGCIFIQKPFSLRMLVHKVREVLEVGMA
jgi:PAS domain S-box-containing protein